MKSGAPAPAAAAVYACLVVVRRTVDALSHGEEAHLPVNWLMLHTAACVKTFA
jgi:hypothetical protein